MEKSNSNYAYILLLALLLLFAAAVLKPFFNSLAWSVLFSFFAYPLYKLLHEKLFKGRFANLSALLVSVVILCFILLPVIWIAIFLAKETAKIYDSILAAGGFMPILQSIVNWLHKVPFFGKYIANWEELTKHPYFTEGTAFLLSKLSTFAKFLSQRLMHGTVSFAMLFVIVGLASFYMLRDAKTYTGFIRDLLPLSGEEKDEFLTKVKVMLRAVVFGVVMTGFVQGVLGGIGWYFAGLSNPVFFGFMMFVFGMIPVIGTPIVWVFGVIYLFATGDHGHAIFLLLWCACFVCSIDNVIRPIFVSGGSDINMLLIFLGLLGGFYLLGFIGLFIGPLVLSLSVYILDIYRKKTISEN